MKFPIKTAQTATERTPLPERLAQQATVAERIAATNGACESDNRSRAIAAKTSGIEDPSDDLKPIYNLIVNGDLSRLKPEQRLTYYQHVCKSLGLNPSTKPLEFITLNGKMVLYALKEAATQLAQRDSVSVEVKAMNKLVDEAIIEVLVRASTPDGRFTDEIGAVPFGSKCTGEAAANARMKAVTKAKRRAVLTHCGLGMLDESELDTIPSGVVKKSGMNIPRAEPMQLAVPDTARNDAEMSVVESEEIPFAEETLIQSNVDIANERLKEEELSKEIARQKQAAVAEKMASYVKKETVHPAMKEGVRHVFDSEKQVQVSAATDAGKPAGNSEKSDAFTWEDKDHRQGLVKHIKGRFPDLKRPDFIKLGEKYKFADKWTVIIEDLNRMRDAGKVEFE